MLAGLVALLAVAALLVWGGVRYRDDIAGAWPQSATVYAALGIPVNAHGLTFTGVNYRRDTQAGQLVLTVEGNLVNIGARELAVPAVEVKLTDGRHRQVDRWTFTPTTNRLKPGEQIAFTTHRTNPPAEARHLEMTLAEAAD